MTPTIPHCRHSPGLLGSSVPSSSSSSFEPAVAALHQGPQEPTLQQVLSHGHRHNTRWIAAAGGAPPLDNDDLAAMVPQAWQEGAAPLQQQGRRKIGRPIAFTGDPDSMDLTDADRRRLKRCTLDQATLT